MLRNLLRFKKYDIRLSVGQIYIIRHLMKKANLDDSSYEPIIELSSKLDKILNRISNKI